MWQLIGCYSGLLHTAIGIVVHVENIAVTWKREMVFPVFLFMGCGPPTIEAGGHSTVVPKLPGEIYMTVGTDNLTRKRCH